MRYKKGLPLLLGLALVGCASKKIESSAEPAPFLLSQPLVRDTFLTREYVCQIRAARQIEVRSLERGYLQHIYVDEGQWVQPGQLLFQLLPLIYQAEYQKAQAEVRYAEVEYTNAKILADSGVISASQLALVQAKLDKARAEAAVAASHLQFASIRAPFAGLIGELKVRLGSLVEEGELLTTLSDPSQLWVYFQVPEQEYLGYMREGRIDTGLQVRLRLANGEYFPYEGKITAIEAEFDNRTGTVAFRATFPNPERLLRHGETGNVVLTQRLPQAIFLPQRATFEVLDKKYVYVLEKDSTVHPRAIEVLAELPHWYVIRRGLSPEERFVVDGLNKIRVGDTLEGVFVPPEEILRRVELHAE